MKATNILWIVDIEEAIKKLNEIDLNHTANIIHVPYEKLLDMSQEERQEMARDYFRHCPGAMEEFLEIPDEIEIPNPENPDWTDEIISEYISEVTGYCHEGFDIV